MRSADIVIAHQVGLHGTVAFGASRREAMRVWSGRGADYYGSLISPHDGMLGLSSRELSESLSAKGGVLSRVKSSLRGRLMRNAARRTEVVSLPIPDDLEVFTASETWHQPRHNTDSVIETGRKWVAGLFGIGPGTERTLVKRIIGVGGETVECYDRGGHVLVNGEPLDEPYIHLDPPFSHGSLDCGSSPVSPRCFTSFFHRATGSLLRAWGSARQLCRLRQ